MARMCVVMVLLLAAVAGAQGQDGGERIYQAIRADNLHALQTLVREHGVDSSDSQGQTPLMVATAFGSVDAVRLLLRSGANARAASSTGVTALHLAAGDGARTRLLVDAGADVNAVSQLGRTPLLVAASARGSLDAARLLLDKGASVDAADGVGMTPLIAAAVVNDAAVVRLLLARGAAVNARANTGQANTALMGAATNGNGELVTLLLQRGADVSSPAPTCRPRSRTARCSSGA